jgi:hypothetical protein
MQSLDISRIDLPGLARQHLDSPRHSPLEWYGEVTLLGEKEVRYVDQEK